MNELSTPRPAVGETVTLSRRHVWILALFVCVPVPLLSFAAGVVPVPQALQRAVASFAPVFGALEGNEVRIDRANGSVESLAVRPVRTHGAGVTLASAVPVSADTVRGASPASSTDGAPAASSSASLLIRR